MYNTDDILYQINDIKERLDNVADKIQENKLPAAVDELQFINGQVERLYMETIVHQAVANER